MDKNEWKAAIMELIQKGWTKRALMMMAANVGDEGDVETMVDNFCANADPAENWREILP